jgi:hypothetical protein
MRIRRQRTEVEQAIRLSMPWEEVYVEEMSSDNRDLFQRRKKAIFMYLDGVTHDEILAATRIPSNELHRLIERSTALARDGVVWGERALIPHFRTNGYTRVVPIAQHLPEHKAGYAGALSQLLNRFPELEETLINKILKKGGNQDLQEFRPKPQVVHKLFIDELKRLGVATTEWPFNTKYRGARAITHYVRVQLDRNFERKVLIYHEGGARAHLSVGTGKEAKIRNTEVYDAWEIDSHKIDADFTIGIPNADGLYSYINLKRLIILALVDRASTAVIWFIVVYSSEVGAADVIRLISESLRELLPAPDSNLLQMHLTGDSGYPGERIPQLRHALPTVLMPDNALSNLATSVSQELRTKLGFLLNYGPPGHFECRPNVERTFENIAQSIFQRLPNTTGASPFKGKAENGAAIARTYKMEANIVEELAFHHFAQHNALESEGLGFLTPLEFIRQKLAQNDAHFVPRHLLNSQVSSATHYRSVMKVKVKCYPDRGVRPYIQLDRVRYSNDVLRKSPWLKNTEISIEVDEQDMRAVRAYFPGGEPIGMLQAAGKWSVTKHSRKTRKAINQLKADRAFTISELDDPVEQYLKYLRNRVSGDQSVQNTVASKDSSRTVATEINRLSTEIASDRPDLVGQFLGTDIKQVAEPQKTQKEDSALAPSLSTRTAIKTVMSTKIPNLKGLMKDF